jgi:hypothetical protein
MPIYTFINKLNNKRYEKIMTYEELIEYIKDPNIEQEYKMNIFRYSDNNGIKDQEMNFLKDPKVHGMESLNLMVRLRQMMKIRFLKL